MNITELEKEKMDIVRELAATNLKISDAKNIIFKLQEDEVKYINEREKKALAGIQKTLDESAELLASTHNNYNEIHELCKTISYFTESLSEAHGTFSELLTDFNTRNDEWDKDVIRTRTEFDEIRRGIATERTFIENEQKGIKAALKKIEEEKKVIESRQSQIKSALKVLEEKKLKVNKK